MTVSKQEHRMGKVYLVGAGPGDPQLLTLKGKACLQIADVVIYDRLVNAALLQHAAPGAEMIDVGKRRGQTGISQAQIHQIMRDRARQGKTVVRLKGGDPFVFGRGGEEAQALAEAGIPFEIVPGVSSAIAVPAYAGVPLTHREYASSVAIVTGHQRSETPNHPVFWERLATSVDTLVILMGMGRLSDIAAALIRGGRPAETPVCVVEWGTYPHQRKVVASLGDIAAKVAEEGLGPPGVIIVGEVVALHEEIAWFGVER